MTPYPTPPVNQDDRDETFTLIQRLELHASGHELAYGHRGICGEAADALTSVRLNTLEEAAKVAEGWRFTSDITEMRDPQESYGEAIRRHVAAAIRALGGTNE